MGQMAGGISSAGIHAALQGGVLTHGKAGLVAVSSEGKQPLDDADEDEAEPLHKNMEEATGAQLLGNVQSAANAGHVLKTAKVANLDSVQPAAAKPSSDMTRSVFAYEEAKSDEAFDGASTDREPMAMRVLEHKGVQCAMKEVAEEPAKSAIVMDED